MLDAPVYLLQRMLHRQTLPAWFWFSLDQCVCLMMLLREIYWLCFLSSKYCCITQMAHYVFFDGGNEFRKQEWPSPFPAVRKRSHSSAKSDILSLEVVWLRWRVPCAKNRYVNNMQIFWSPDIFLESLAVLLICGSGCDATSSFPSNNKSLVVAEKNLNEGLLMLLLWLNCLLLSLWPELWKPAEHYCK